MLFILGCRGKVCINGGTLDMGTCNCTCVAGVKNYGEDIFGEDICERKCQCRFDSTHPT